MTRVQLAHMATLLTSLAFLVPGWVALDHEAGIAAVAVVVVVGAATTLAVAWMRQQPISPGDDDAYARTALGKIAVAAVPAALAAVLAVAAGFWVYPFGLAWTLAGLWLGRPSAADRERHHLAYLG